MSLGSFVLGLGSCGYRIVLVLNMDIVWVVVVAKYVIGGRVRKLGKGKFEKRVRKISSIFKLC